MPSPGLELGRTEALLLQGLSSGLRPVLKGCFRERPMMGLEVSRPRPPPGLGQKGEVSLGRKYSWT